MKRTHDPARLAELRRQAAFHNMRVRLIDVDSGVVEWTGYAQELLDDNEGDPEVEEALLKLQRGARSVLMGGGAAGAWRIERKAASQ